MRGCYNPLAAAPFTSPCCAPWQEELALLDKRLQAEQHRATVLRARNDAGHERARSPETPPSYEPDEEYHEAQRNARVAGAR